jgi:trans-2,3-dihydro-3-hydroxyanthranilate isomerase
VFVLPSRTADARLRIFTPARELPFAGHPVLGAGAVLAEARGRAQLKLETGVGVIGVAVEAGGEEAIAWMEQPFPRWSPFDRPAELLEALGAQTSLLPVEVYDNGIPHVYVAGADAAALAGLRPDFSALASVCPATGVVCFARLAEGWKVRMFAPGHGIPEDPATGSAAGPLAVHLIRHGHAQVGEQLRLEQGAEIGRPSQLHVRTAGRGGQVDSVLVGGGVIGVGRGEFRLGL